MGGRKRKVRGIVWIALRVDTMLQEEKEGTLHLWRDR